MRLYLTLLILCVTGCALAAEEYPFGTPGTDERIQYGRGRPMDIEHLKLDVRVDVEKAFIQGTTTLTFSPVGTALEEVVLDSVDLDITSVTDSSGTTLDFEVTLDKLKIYPPAPLPPGESITIQIVHSVSEPEKGMHFRNAANGYSESETQAWSQGEAQDHRYWFPCFDSPNERTSTEVIATVDNRYIAISNGSMVGQQDNDDGTRTFHWRQAQPHANYLISLVVGPFQEITDTTGPVPLHVYHLPGQAEMARLTYASTNDMLQFFQECIDVPYPWDRYSQVAVVDFIAGGMENTSITTLEDRSLLTPAALLTGSSNSLIAHELAHQWFGNLLTCRDWSEIWLNEGFATLFDALYMEYAYGTDAYTDVMLDNAAAVLRFDTGERRKPTVNRLYALPDDLFTPRVYQKGGWILHMLRRKLGDELFFKGVSKYVKDNFNDVVETNDLLRTLEEVSGVSLERFFDQWVYHAGYPELTVTYDWDQSQMRAKVVVKQTQTVDEIAPVFHLDTAIRFAFDDGDQLEEISITKAEETFEFNLKKRPEYVRFDPDMTILKKLEFKKPKPMLLAQLKDDPDIAGRYQAIEQLAQLKGEDIVDALDSVLREAAYWGERVSAAQALGSLKGPIALEKLLAARKTHDGSTRLAIIEAFENHNTPEVAAALVEVIQNDPSPYIVSEAINILSRFRDPRTPELAASALRRDSHNETIRIAALNALGYLEDTSSLEAVVKIATDGPRRARGSAISALGNIGKAMDDKSRVRDALLGLLDSNSERIRASALRALGVLGEETAIPAIQVFVASSAKEQDQRAGRNSIEKIRSAKEQSEEVKALRQRVVALEEEKKKLEERLDKIEQVANEKENAS